MSTTASAAAGAGAGAGAGAVSGAVFNTSNNVSGGSKTKAPYLVIHLDANETVLFRDDAGGKSQIAILGEIIAEAAWGRLSPSTNNTTPNSSDASLNWELVSTELGRKPPQGFDKSDVGLTAGKLAVYSDYVKELLHPRVSMSSLSGDELKNALEENELRKRKRVQLFTDFVSSGNPGERLEAHMTALLTALTIPEDKREACARACHELRTGYRFLCPAYFNLLLHLNETREDFAVTFRTYGSDSPMLVDEHNMFCSGRHPLYPGVRMDGTCGSTDRRIHLPRDSGRFFRQDGVIQLSTVTKHGLVDFVSGWKGVYNELCRKLQGKEGRFMVIRDHYQYWHEQDRSAYAGKVLPIDSRNHDVHQIFFDDNIGDDDAKIVDVYDIATDRHLPFDETKDVYIVRAVQLENIRDPDYFVKKVALCEQRRAATLHK